MYSVESIRPRKAPASTRTQHSPALDIVELRVTEELLQRPDVGAALQQMSCEGVAQGVDRRVLVHPGSADRVAEFALEDRSREVITFPALEFGVPSATRGRKHVLPRQRPGGTWVLPRESVRHRRATRPPQ